MARLARYGHVQKSEFDEMSPTYSVALEGELLRLRNIEMQGWASLMVMCANSIAAGRILELAGGGGD